MLGVVLAQHRPGPATGLDPPSIADRADGRGLLASVRRVVDRDHRRRCARARPPWSPLTAPAGLGAYAGILVLAAAAVLVVPLGRRLQRRVVEAPRGRGGPRRRRRTPRDRGADGPSRGARRPLLRHHARRPDRRADPRARSRSSATGTSCSVRRPAARPSRPTPGSGKRATRLRRSGSSGSRPTARTTRRRTCGSTGDVNTRTTQPRGLRAVPRDARPPGRDRGVRPVVPRDARLEASGSPPRPRTLRPPRSIPGDALAGGSA